MFTRMGLVEFRPEGGRPTGAAGPVEDDVVEVEAARIPDRDRLLRTLTDQGYDARPVDEVHIAVHHATGDTSREVYRDLEDDVLALGSSFVPIKHEGVIYLRPPIG